MYCDRCRCRQVYSVHLAACCASHCCSCNNEKARKARKAPALHHMHTSWCVHARHLSTCIHHARVYAAAIVVAVAVAVAVYVTTSQNHHHLGVLGVLSGWTSRRPIELSMSGRDSSERSRPFSPTGPGRGTTSDVSATSCSVCASGPLSKS